MSKAVLTTAITCNRCKRPIWKCDECKNWFQDGDTVYGCDVGRHYCKKCWKDKGLIGVKK